MLGQALGRCRSLARIVLGLGRLRALSFLIASESLPVHILRIMHQFVNEEGFVDVAVE